MAKKINDDEKRFKAICEHLTKVEGNGFTLNEADRTFYLQQYCKHLGLSPIGEPLRWHSSYNKKTGQTVMTVYATSKASKQLIEKNKISIKRTDRWDDSENYYVEVEASIGEQKVVNAGFCAKNGFLSSGNAQIASYTKAMRRAVLTICGTGLLDETEIETMSGDLSSNTVKRKSKTENNEIDELELINSLENSDDDVDEDIDQKIEAITNDAMDTIEGVCDFSDGGFSDVDFG